MRVRPRSRTMPSRAILAHAGKSSRTHHGSGPLQPRVLARGPLCELSSRRSCTAQRAARTRAVICTRRTTSSASRAASSRQARGQGTSWAGPGGGRRPRRPPRPAAARSAHTAAAAAELTGEEAVAGTPAPAVVAAGAVWLTRLYDVGVGNAKKCCVCSAASSVMRLERRVRQCSARTLRTRFPVTLNYMNHS